MLYRKMYLYAFVFTLLYFGMDVLLGIYAVPNMGGESGMLAAYVILIELVLPRMSLMLLAYSSLSFFDRFAYHFANGWSNVENWEIWMIAVLAVFIITRIYLGYFGNAIYYRIVKKRIKKGYHQVDDAHPTSILSCFGSIFYLLGLGYHYTSEQRHLVDKKSISAYLNPKRKTSLPC